MKAIRSDQDKAGEILKLTHPTAEITVLTTLRRWPKDKTEDIIDLLQARDFSDPRRQVAYQAMVNILRSIEPMDDRAVLAECIHVARDMKQTFRIDQEYLDSLDGDPLSGHAYAQTVKHFSWLRDAGGYAIWLINRLKEYPEPEELFVEAQEKMAAMHPPLQRRGRVYGSETVALHREILDRRDRECEAGHVNPFTWPWVSWNDKIRPLRAGQVGLIAAPDGIGKSTYAEAIAEHWARGGMHVVYVHLEDDLEYKVDRRLARWSRVPLKTFEDGTKSKALRDRLHSANAEMEKQLMTLHYLYMPGYSMAEIVQELAMMQAEGTCQAIVFDYLDKVAPTRAENRLFGENYWERQAYDMEQIKTFAERAHMPALVLSQGNKSMQGGGIKTRQSIAGSGGRTQKAQLVVILTRDLVENQPLQNRYGAIIADVGEYSPVVHVRVDKQNRGKSGMQFNQYIDGEHFDVRDVETKKVDL